MEPWKWTEKDIINLLTEKEKESLILDYKACGSLSRNDDKKRMRLVKMFQL